MDPELASSPAIDPAPFEPAMPERVREVLAQARRGEGVAAQWLARTSGAGWGRVGDCFLLLGHKSNVSSEIVGWIVGITMFDDERQRLAMVLKATTTLPSSSFVGATVEAESKCPASICSVAASSVATVRITAA